MRLTNQQKDRLLVVYHAYGTEPFSHKQAHAQLKEQISESISQQSANGFVNSLVGKGIIEKVSFWNDTVLKINHYGRCNYRIIDRAERLCKLLALGD
jgi:hypothetical protein